MKTLQSFIEQNKVCPQITALQNKSGLFYQIAIDLFLNNPKKNFIINKIKKSGLPYFEFCQIVPNGKKVRYIRTLTLYTENLTAEELFYKYFYLVDTKKIKDLHEQYLREKTIRFFENHKKTIHDYENIFRADDEGIKAVPLGNNPYELSQYIVKFKNNRTKFLTYHNAELFFEGLIQEDYHGRNKETRFSFQGFHEIFRHKNTYNPYKIETELSENLIKNTLVKDRLKKDKNKIFTKPILIL